MASRSKTGASLKDAIALDSDSDAENSPPIASGSRGGGGGQSNLLSNSSVRGKRSAWRDMRADSDSDTDSPPPLITKSNLVQSGDGTNSSFTHRSRPPTAKRGRPFAHHSTTRQRLMNGGRSPSEGEDDSDHLPNYPRTSAGTTSFVKAAPRLPMRPFASGRENGSSSGLIQVPGRLTQHGSNLKSENASGLEGGSSAANLQARLFASPTTSQTKVEPISSQNIMQSTPSSSSTQSPSRSGSTVVLRQIIEFRVDASQTVSMPNGRVLESLAMLTERNDFDWKIDLIDSATGRFVGEWSNKEADEVQKLVNKYDLKLAFRYFNPSSVISSTLSSLTSSTRRYAVLEIQCPALGPFAQYCLPLLKNKLKAYLCVIATCFPSGSAMPTKVVEHLHCLLPRFLRYMEEIQKKYPTLPRLTVAPSSSASNINRSAASVTIPSPVPAAAAAPPPPAAVNRALPPATSSAALAVPPTLNQAPQLQAPQAAPQQNSLVNHAINQAINFLSSSASAFGVPFGGMMPVFPEASSFYGPTGPIAPVPSTMRTSANLPSIPPNMADSVGGSHMPGSYHDLYRYGSRINPEDHEILNDPEMLRALMEDNGDDDEDYIPIDPEMQDILNNMADGTFHGTDALATLYGDKGVDVAKLSLYADLDHLKQRGLKTELHSHQLQGLLWMIKAEHRRISSTVGTTRGLWQTRKDASGRYYYFNTATRKCKRKAPALPRGGINSDSMGLGKTIQIIATCLADRHRVPKGIKPKYGVEEDSKVKEEIKEEGKGEGGSKQSAKMKEIKAGPSNESIDVDGIDSEKDYTSDTDSEKDDEEEETSDESDTSITESETDEDMPQSKRVKNEDDELHRPTDSEGNKIKNESESVTEEEEDEKPRRSGVRSKSKVDLKKKKQQSSEEKKKASQKKRKRAAKAKKKEKEKAKKEEESKKQGANQEEKINYNETTLVICPLSVLQNWTGQVDQHCDRRKVSYFVHHGDGAKNIRKRNAFASYFEKHTFVFTTYDTVRLEYRVIQNRRKAEMEAQRREAEKQRREEEAKLQKALGRDVDEKVKPTIDRKGAIVKRDGTTSIEETEVSDFKPDSDAEDIKPGTSKSGLGKKRGRGGKGKAKGKGKGKASESKWYESDDSMMESEDELYEEEDVISDDPKEIPLFGVNWRRIVLDEAHICRNAKTNLYNAICELKGERRWAVTGTPIVNSTKDLGALAAWCGLEPFKYDLKQWSNLIERPLKKAVSAERAAGLLRSVVTSICLRRHKSMKNAEGEPIVKLPDVKFYKLTIPLTVADRDYYNKCETACREHFARWVSSGHVNEHRSAILVFLLRLRQMSCHRRLIGSQLLEEIQNRDWDAMDQAQPVANLTKTVIKELQDKLRSHVEVGDDCPVCMEALLGREPMITPCGHPFCKGCLTSILHSSLSGPPKCPMDRQILPKMEQMIEMPPEREESIEVNEAYEDDINMERTSAKVNEVMKLIRATLGRDPTEKILIFSNFVKFLNIFGEELRENNIPHARFNGDLNVKRRDLVLQSFCRPINPRQAKVMESKIASLERQYQRERAAQKKAAEATEGEEGGAPSSDAAAPFQKAPSSTSSSILNSLRGMDSEIQRAKASSSKGKGKQRAQDEDIFGDNPSVLLISMGCGALGLNLTAASTVLLCDPWWQSSAEQQAIDRTHRIGQTRDIKVFQLICENTVEARVLEIQAIKEGLTETAFSGMRATGSASDKRQKIESNWKELGRMFGMDQREIDRLSRQAAANAAANSNSVSLQRR